MNALQQSRSIPPVLSIATDPAIYVSAGDSRSEFTETKAICVKLCYRALEQLSGFVIPEAVSLDADLLGIDKVKTTVS